jgi:polysaccharide biosynthesis PFTS motif protein
LKNKKVIVFYNLHPLNIIPALFLSFRYRVVYWRKNLLLGLFVKKFEQIYKPGSFTQGDWVEITAPIFFELKTKINANRFKDRLYLNYKNSEIDMTMSAMQRVVMQYERIYHFYKLIEFWKLRHIGNENIFVADFIARRYLNDLELVVDSGNINFSFRINPILDRMWEYLQNILYLGMVFVRVLQNFFKSNILAASFNKNKIKYFWHCLSFNEIASTENSYDATALIQRGLLSSEESLFFLPVEPNEDQIHWLSKNHIQWVSNRCLYKNIPKLIQIRIFFWLSKIVILSWGMQGKQALKGLIIAPLISDIIKFEFFNYINAKVLLTGQSGGTLESPIISLARGLNKKTIWWSYAGVGTKHIPRPLAFNYFNEQVEESITLSEEKWIWFELDKTMLQKRSLLPFDELQTNYRTLGPIMSGDSTWLSKSPLQARDEYKLNGNSNCKIWISVFDIPTFDDYVHVEHRWPAGNAFTKKMQAAFFMDIKAILEKFSDIGIIYKPKRSLKGKNTSKYIFQTEMLELMNDNNKWIKSKRLIVLSNNIDPYIPIALCDYAIAMPYSSVLLAVLASNRGGVYYDSTSTICSTYPEELNNITLCNQTSLFEKIQLWRVGSDEINIPLTKIIRYDDDDDVGKNFSSNLEKIYITSNK